MSLLKLLLGNVFEMTARICRTDILKLGGEVGVFYMYEEAVGVTKWLTLRR
jgi:hypothetical protein